MRTFTASICLALLACGSAEMGPGAPAYQATDAPTPDSPYEVELISDGQTLPTYAHKGRFYVQGTVGQRYTIRVTNPTPVRVEAVISVDGLDVIDGETANTNKRGYVVMPHSTINVDGFRVSTSHVAAFRFSSVDDSYAGRKGKARNVGAIGVAIFAEKAAPTMILPERRVSNREWEDGDDDAADYSAESARPGRVGAAQRTKKSADRAIRRRPAPPAVTGGESGGAALDSDDYYEPAPREEQCCSPTTNRPGLGTEYGERRYSAVGFTRFVRSSSKPTAYAELRYNNAAGLAALGIITGPGFDENELTRRETAEPFPGQRFSRPPQ